MSDELNLEELMNIQGLPGLTDEDGNELTQFEIPEIPNLVSNPADRTSDEDADYTRVRDNYHFQQELMKLMALRAYENAMMSDSPRAIEVFSTLMSNMANNNKEMLNVHKTMNDIRQQPKGQTGDTTINAQSVFVGSPTELMGQVGGQLEAKARVAHESRNTEDDNTTVIEQE